MVEKADNREMLLDVYLTRIRGSIPRSGTPEWEIWSLLKNKTRSAIEERTLWVLLESTYRQSKAYEAASANRIKLSKATKEERKARTVRAFDFVGLGIVSGIVDPKTLTMKIDPALVVGRLLGHAGTDDAVQAEGAERMKKHADEIAETKRRRTESIARGRRERQEGIAFAEELRRRQGTPSVSSDTTPQAAGETKLLFAE